ncbi:MAG TPA: phage terminase small subunit P27 family [Acidimicrobiales bacterium]
MRGDRSDRVNTDEPLPSAGEVTAPSWLAEGALAVWSALAPDLERQRVLTAWDVEAFATYCDAVERHRRAAENLDRQGEIVEAPVFNRNGERTGERLEKNPWFFVWKDCAEIMSRYGARFGLTPSDRSQLKVGSDGEKGSDLLT